MTNVMQSTTNKNPIETNEAFHTTTSKYKFQNSSEIVNYIVSQGFQHTSTSFAQVKKIEKAGFQKHVMIFDHSNFMIDDTNRLQLLVTNSHDGTGSLKFNLGVFRTVCANGLVVGDSFTEYRVPHRGVLFYDKVKTALSEIILNANQFGTTVKRWQAITLDDNEIEMLGVTALTARIQESLDKKELKLERFSRVDRIARIDDAGNNLWNVFNRVQESIMRGNVKYITSDVDQRQKVTKLRAVKSIDKTIELNKQLWNMASQYDIAA